MSEEGTTVRELMVKMGVNPDISGLKKFNSAIESSLKEMDLFFRTEAQQLLNAEKAEKALAAAQKKASAEVAGERRRAAAQNRLMLRQAKEEERREAAAARSEAEKNRLLLRQTADEQRRAAAAQREAAAAARRERKLDAKEEADEARLRARVQQEKNARAAALLKQQNKMEADAAKERKRIKDREAAEDEARAKRQADTQKKALHLLGIGSPEQAAAMFNRGLSDLIRTLALGTAAAGGFVAGLIAITKETAAAAMEASRGGQHIGTTAESYQELHYAAKQAGMDVRQFDLAMRQLSRNAFMADQTKSGNKFWKEIGINVRDANGHLKAADELMLEISGKVVKMREGDKQGFTTKLFGARTGHLMMPMLNLGPDGIRKQMAEYKAMGNVFSDKDISNAKLLTQEMNRLQALFTGLTRVVGRELVPVFYELAKDFDDWYVANVDWIKLKVHEAVRELVKWFERGKVAVEDLNAGVQKIGGWRRVFEGFALAVAAFVTGGVLIDFAEMLLGVVGMLMSVTTAAAAADVAVGALMAEILSFLTPVALVVGLAALAFAEFAAILLTTYLLLEDIYGYLVGWDSQTGRFIEWLRKGGVLANALADAIEGVADMFREEGRAMLRVAADAEFMGETIMVALTPVKDLVWSILKGLALAAIGPVGWMAAAGLEAVGAGGHAAARGFSHVDAGGGTGKGSVHLNIGGIHINGTNLSPAQLAAAVQDGISKAAANVRQHGLGAII